MRSVPSSATTRTTSVTGRPRASRAGRSTSSSAAALKSVIGPSASTATSASPMPATTASSRPRSSASSTAAVRRSAVIVRIEPAIESKVEPRVPSSSSVWTSAVTSRLPSRMAVAADGEPAQPGADALAGDGGQRQRGGRRAHRDEEQHAVQVLAGLLELRGGRGQHERHRRRGLVALDRPGDVEAVADGAAQLAATAQRGDAELDHLVGAGPTARSRRAPSEKSTRARPASGCSAAIGRGPRLEVAVVELRW